MINAAHASEQPYITDVFTRVLAPPNVVHGKTRHLSAIAEGEVLDLQFEPGGCKVFKSCTDQHVRTRLPRCCGSLTES